MSFQRSELVDGVELVTGYNRLYLRVDTPKGKQWLVMHGGKWLTMGSDESEYCENEYGEFIATH